MKSRRRRTGSSHQHNDTMRVISSWMPIVAMAIVLAASSAHAFSVYSRAPTTRSARHFLPRVAFVPRQDRTLRPFLWAKKPQEFDDDDDDGASFQEEFGVDEILEEEGIDEGDVDYADTEAVSEFDEDYEEDDEDEERRGVGRRRRGGWSSVSSAKTMKAIPII